MSVHALFVAALLVSTLSGCSGAARSPSATFSFQGISFDYERGWNSGRFEQRSPIILRSLTYLSNQRFDVVCTRSSPRPGITAFGCTPPIPVLRAGGLVIHWLEIPAAGDRLSSFSGDATTIAGYPARLSRSATNQDCVPGTRRAIQATIGSIRDSGGGEFLVMTACLTRPAQIGAVTAMLGSLKVEG